MDDPPDIHAENTGMDVVYPKFFCRFGCLLIYQDLSFPYSDTGWHSCSSFIHSLQIRILPGNRKTKSVCIQEPLLCEETAGHNQCSFPEALYLALCHFQRRPSLNEAMPLPATLLFCKFFPVFNFSQFTKTKFQAAENLFFLPRPAFSGPQKFLQLSCPG